MPLRHREQDLRTQLFGTYTSNIGPTTFTEDKTDGFRRVCDDFEGNRSNANDFSLLEVFTYYPVLSCASPNGCIWNAIPIQTKFSGWEPRNVGYGALTGLDRSNWAWEILSKTNPSLPHVSVPTFVGELKDLPGLVKGYGNNLLKNVANGYLSWRWAIRPMIGDLRKLFNFMKAVDDRTTMLMRLRTGATIRKRCSLGQDTDAPIDSPHTYFMESRNGGGLDAVAYATKSYKAWGSSSWKLLPDSTLPTLGYGKIRDFAKRLTFGFTSHEALATAWELCPWSWLADWFGNTGKIIAATNNSIGLTWKDICYMRTSSTNVVVNNWTGSPWLLDAIGSQNYVVTWKRKERYVCAPVVPFPFPQLPMLTNGQWSILAALAAQRL